MKTFFLIPVEKWVTETQLFSKKAEKSKNNSTGQETLLSLFFFSQIILSVGELDFCVSAVTGEWHAWPLGQVCLLKCSHQSRSLSTQSLISIYIIYPFSSIFQISDNLYRIWHSTFKNSFPRIHLSFKTHSNVKSSHVKQEESRKYINLENNSHIC